MIIFNISFTIVVKFGKQLLMIDRIKIDCNDFYIRLRFDFKNKKLVFSKNYVLSHTKHDLCPKRYYDYPIVRNRKLKRKNDYTQLASDLYSSK